MSDVIRTTIKTKIKKIKKRDGRVVDFDPDKIATAIWNAVEAVGGKDRERPKFLAEQVVRLLEKKLKPGQVPTVEQVQDLVEKVLVENGHYKTAKAYILYRQRRAQARKACAVLGVKDDLKLPLNTIVILAARYLLRDEERNIIETTSQLFGRVARAIAQVEKKYGKSKKYVKNLEEKFYQMMTNFEFIPNSPTLMNAGAGRGLNLSACFVLPVEDDMGSIFDALKAMALVQQSGGGTGFSFSKLRPAGDVVRSTGGISSGPISFMKIFDAATEQIRQGGKRRGANMGLLRVDHPDILDFIVCKEVEGVLRNFNISVGVTDKFMKAVETDGYIDLINPRTKKPVKRIKARAIWNLLATMAWKNGEPGVVFLDTIDKHNPTPHVGKIEATNPCVTGDTMIATDAGLVPIRKLHNPQRILTMDGRYHRLAWVGKTGIKEVFKVRTRAGYEVKATSQHKFLTKDGIWKPVEELTRDDELVVQPTGSFGNLHIERELALMLGWLVGDGHLSKDLQDVIFYFNTKEKREILPIFKNYLDKLNKRKVKPLIRGNRVSLKYSSKIARAFYELGLRPFKAFEKEVPKTIFLADEETVKNFLSALFGADGSVQGNRRKGVSIRLSSTSLRLLKQVQLLLLQFGIFSRIYEGRREPGWKKLPDSKRKPKKYFCRIEHELIISRKSMFKFMEKIGFCLSSKMLKFERIKPQKIYRDNLDLRVEKIERLGKEDVYDLTEPITHSFTANGIVVHNCGEVPLLPYESCNLGSINLSKFVEDGKINWEKLRERVRLAVRFLDNIIDANIYPIKEIEKMTKANRKIGLGVMGFADMLIELGIPYNSEKALKIAEKIMKFITQEARKMSVELGKEKGSFPNFKGSVWDKKGYKYMRNATVTTIAPTGTISEIAGCSQGIEPLFAIAYVRNVRETLGYDLTVINPLFEMTAIREGFYSDELIKKIAGSLSIQHVKEVPKKWRRIFVTAMDIAPEWHVRMQAAFQKHTDNAISKTINLPNHATPSDVERIFMLAWKLGCKGITVYRFGSRRVQVIGPVAEAAAPSLGVCEVCEM